MADKGRNRPARGKSLDVPAHAPPANQRMKAAATGQENPDGSMALMAAAEHFSGPMPHPDHLERYEALFPGASELIFREFQAQGAHRRELEHMIVKGNEDRANRGQWIGLFIALVFLATSAWLIMNDHDTAGAALGGATLVGLVGVFVVGKLRPDHEE